MGTRGLSAFAAVILAAVATACGGGGGGGGGVSGRYVVSGHIQGVTTGVTVSLHGEGGIQTTTTNGTGDYTFLDVANGTYWVSAERFGVLRFGSSADPNPPSVTVSGANATAANLVAVFGAGGAITGPASFAVFGAHVALSAAPNTSLAATPDSDVSGHFFYPVESGTYTFTPSAPGYTFVPASITTIVTTTLGALNFTAVPDVASYAVSGTLTSDSASNGRIYVTVHDITCPDCSPMAGTSAPDDGAAVRPFTVHGLRPGTYYVRAWHDVFEHGVRNAADPVRYSSQFTITNADVGGLSLDLVTPAVTAPLLIDLTALPGDGVMLLSWDIAREEGYLENASSYQLSWGPDAAATTGGTRSVAPHEDGHYLLGGLTAGTDYYFKIRAVNPAGWGPWSAIAGPVKAAGVSSDGASTFDVSGVVSVAGTHAGPLHVVLADDAHGTYRLQRITNPTYPQAFSVSGVPAGTYQVVAIVDTDWGGSIDSGDVTNFSSAPSVTVTSAAVTGVAVALDTAKGHERVTTEHVRSSGGADSYNLVVELEDGVRRALRAVLGYGRGVTVPRDLPVLESGGYSAFFQVAGVPAVGDRYGVKVEWDDGTTEVLTATVTGVLGNTAFAQNLTASTNSGGGTAAAPFFIWSAPSSPPAGYGYRVSLWGNGAGWWYPDSNVPLASSVNSALYNADGRATPATLGTGTYTWSVIVEDAQRNSARQEWSYTVP